MICAVRELQELGYMDEEKACLILKSEKARMKSKERAKREKIQAKRLLLIDEQNADFAYIAGFTTGGVPYGVSWDELDTEERTDLGYYEGFALSEEDLPYKTTKRRESFN